jgi:hypothetical protein
VFYCISTGYNMQDLQEFVEAEVASGLLGLERIHKLAIEKGFFTDQTKPRQPKAKPR